MPEYNYVCKNCGNEFMIEKKISEYQPIESCPNCGSLSNRDMKKNYCNGNYVVKCTGFYGKHST